GSLHFAEQDIFCPEFCQQTFDIISCHFFCHHLTDAELVAFFKQLSQQARLGIMINDLHRHPLSYLGFKLLSLFKSFSPMVRHDALVSIRRGFVKRELVALLQQAGIQNYQIKWQFPFYFNIIIRT
ncbi:MAG TPA: SAM-dependent methyltransferase, partial [Gammaproteobacteria bacterium]|nr:SAM-dependent methyltransferase [Gammaproteobacteria bacterium]